MDKLKLLKNCDILHIIQDTDLYPESISFGGVVPSGIESGFYFCKEGLFLLEGLFPVA